MNEVFSSFATKKKKACKDKEKNIIIKHKDKNNGQHNLKIGEESILTIKQDWGKHMLVFLWHTELAYDRHKDLLKWGGEALHPLHYLSFINTARQVGFYPCGLICEVERIVASFYIQRKFLVEEGNIRGAVMLEAGLRPDAVHV